jgi:hypothetical protein
MRFQCKSRERRYFQTNNQASEFTFSYDNGVRVVNLDDNVNISRTGCGESIREKTKASARESRL